MYQGGSKTSEYKSFCRFCGQRNFNNVKETGNICGRCRKPGRIDFERPLLNVYVSTKPTDMEEDFEDWALEELKERVKLVQEFDALADSIVKEAQYMAENFFVEEKTYYIPKTKKVLSEITA